MTQRGSPHESNKVYQLDPPFVNYILPHVRLLFVYVSSITHICPAPLAPNPQSSSVSCPSFLHTPPWYKPVYSIFLYIYPLSHTAFSFLFLYPRPRCPRTKQFILSYSLHLWFILSRSPTYPSPISLLRIAPILRSTSLSALFAFTIFL